MKKQTHYRVYLYPNSSSIENELATWAIKSNGDPTRWMTLEQLKMIFDIEKLKYPSVYAGRECHVIGHNLTLDFTETKRNYVLDKDNTTTNCMLLIEEIELCKLEPEEPPYSLTEQDTY